MRGRGKEIKLKRIEEKERWIEGEKLDWSIMGDLVERVRPGDIIGGKKENTSPQLIMCAENASTNNHKLINILDLELLTLHNLHTSSVVY